MFTNDIIDNIIILLKIKGDKKLKNEKLDNREIYKSYVLLKKLEQSIGCKSLLLTKREIAQALGYNNELYANAEHRLNLLKNMKRIVFDFDKITKKYNIKI